MNHHPMGVAGRLGHYLDRIGGESNFGVMCDAIERQAYTSTECPACQASGFVEVSEQSLRYYAGQLAKTRDPERMAEIRRARFEASICGVCDGTGWSKHRVKRGRVDSMFATVRCGKCRGCGEVLDEDLEDVCPRCGGDMCLLTLSVRETGSSKKGRVPPGAVASYDEEWHAAETSHVDEAQVVALGQMSRLMHALKQRRPEAAAVLEAYYGPSGDKWAGTTWGRVFAVWRLTRAGRRLVEDGQERSKLGHGFLLEADDMLASERDAEDRATTPNFRRRALIRQADQQARAMFAAASKALEAVS